LPRDLDECAAAPTAIAYGLERQQSVKTVCAVNSGASYVVMSGSGMERDDSCLFI